MMRNKMIHHCDSIRLQRVQMLLGSYGFSRQKWTKSHLLRMCCYTQHTSMSTLNLGYKSSLFYARETFPRSGVIHSRPMVFISTLPDLIPEFVKHYSMWGGTATILKGLHANHLPYWGGICYTNIMVRTTLLPLVVQGAKTATEMGKVAPEVQFLFTNYIQDSNKLKQQPNAKFQLKDGTEVTKYKLMIMTADAYWALYRKENLTPFDMLKSPLMQLPVYWYFSVDLRKLINGGDPELAQELTEASFLWVTDLTEPDPWHGLPILCGLFLYLNVEIAVGKLSLSGETASKSNIAKYMKDAFQSLSIFMPCITATSPAGVQIYLLTSFIFTLFQGAALRHNPIRKYIGLPPYNTPISQSKFLQDSIQLSILESTTRGIISPKAAFNYSPYMSNYISKSDMEEMMRLSKERNEQKKLQSVSGIGVRSPQYQDAYEESPVYLIVNQIKNMQKRIDSSTTMKKKDSIPLNQIQQIGPTQEEMMEAANRGELPRRPIQITTTKKNVPKNETLQIKHLKRMKHKKNKGSNSSNTRKR